MFSGQIFANIRDSVINIIALTLKFANSIFIFLDTVVGCFFMFLCSASIPAPASVACREVVDYRLKRLYRIFVRAGSRNSVQCLEG